MIFSLKVKKLKLTVNLSRMRATHTQSHAVFAVSDSNLAPFYRILFQVGAVST